MKCPYFDTCDAPLCVNDASSLKNGIWYPDEPICKIRNAPEWVKRQRKIAKKVREKNKYFTLEMLKHRARITAALEGLDPDKPHARQLKEWFEKHKELSAEARKKWADNVKKMKGKNQG